MPTPDPEISGSTGDEQPEMTGHGEYGSDGVTDGSVVCSTVYAGYCALKDLTPEQLLKFVQAVDSTCVAGAERQSVTLQSDPEIRQLYRMTTMLGGSEAAVELLQDPDLGPLGLIDVPIGQEKITSLSFDDMLSLSVHLARMALVAYREMASNHDEG
ncbi:hypothetical protein J2S53_003428 [Actinopolyspora lacussalsi]|nr:hypothetical protein [Actinopolyspora lacussalsi]